MEASTVAIVKPIAAGPFPALKTVETVFNRTCSCQSPGPCSAGRHRSACPSPAAVRKQSREATTRSACLGSAPRHVGVAGVGLLQLGAGRPDLRAARGVAVRAAARQLGHAAGITTSIKTTTNTNTRL